MKNLNLKDDWIFLQSETHKEKPSTKNLMKRELIFSLQILLPNLKNKKQKVIYQKTKKFYLSLP